MRPEELDDVFAGLVLKKRADVLLNELVGLKRRPGEDSIHDTRVQSRRMRAALEAFQDLYAADPWQALYDAVRGVTKSLGGPRETEVSLALVKDLTSRGETPVQLCGEYLEEKLRNRFRRQQRRLRKNLRRIDSRNLRLRFKNLLAERDRTRDPRTTQGIVIPLKTGRDAKKRARPVIAPRQPFLVALHGESVERARRILADLAAPLLAFRVRPDFRRSTDARLHKLRISAKKLRYAMEIFDEVWPGGLRQQIESARALQEAGGHHQDWAVLCRRLQKEIRRLARQGATHLASQMEGILAEAEVRKSVLRQEVQPALIQLQACLRELLHSPPFAGQTERAVAVRA
jgi:CHAD domain-containing protein